MEPMSEKTDHAAAEAARIRPRYAPPAILWEEDYRPTAFGVSCAKLAGDPACILLVTT